MCARVLEVNFDAVCVQFPIPTTQYINLVAWKICTYVLLRLNAVLFLFSYSLNKKLRYCAYVFVRLNAVFFLFSYSLNTKLRY